MRVLFAAEALVPPIGGAEELAGELLTGLAMRGHEVVAVCLADQGVQPFRRALAPLAGVRIVVAPAPGVRREDREWRWRAARAVAVADRVGDVRARGFAPDVALTQLHAAPAVAAAVAPEVPVALLIPSGEVLCKHAFLLGSGCAAAGRDCRSCPAARALPAEEALLLRAARGRQHALLRDGAAVRIVPGRGLAGAIRGWGFGVPVEVVPPVTAMPADAGARRDGPIVAAAARWSAAKGVAIVAALAAQLPGRRFVISSHGLPDAVAALPNVELRDAPLAKLLAGAAVALMPSQVAEGFGRVAWQAMAAGVPVLATDEGGGLTELVPAPELIAPATGVERWAAAIESLLSAQPDWERARARGRAAAAAVRLEATVPAIEALLERIAAVRAAPPSR